MSEAGVVLIVDDDPANIEILNEILEDEYDVLIATDGVRGLEVARKEKPDLILLDVMMPGKSGYEVCRELKEDEATAHIPVMFLTALENDQSETYGLELGAIDYIAKPIRPTIVRVRVRNQVELKKARDLLEELSLVDTLTELSNRNQFHRRFDESLKLANREGFSLALLMLDLDRFKPINDTFGHPFGDAVLKEAASVFARLSRETDVVARLGGDEFAILIIHPENRRAAEAFAQRIVQEIAKPITISDEEVQIGTSIGISFYPDDGTDKDSLIKKADLALYQAKDEGRNTFRSYSDTAGTVPADL